MSGNSRETSYDIKKLRANEKRNALILQQEELARQQQRVAADLAEMQGEPSEEVEQVEPAGAEATNTEATSSRANGKNTKGTGKSRGRPAKKNKKLPIVQAIEEAPNGSELLPTESFSAPVVNQLVTDAGGSDGTSTETHQASGGSATADALDDVFLPGDGTLALRDDAPTERRSTSASGDSQSGRTQHPRFLSGSPVNVERITFTDQQNQRIDEMILQTIRERDREWASARNDLLQARTD